MEARPLQPLLRYLALLQVEENRTELISSFNNYLFVRENFHGFHILRYVDGFHSVDEPQTRLELHIPRMHMHRHKSNLRKLAVYERGLLGTHPKKIFFYEYLYP